MSLHDDDGEHLDLSRTSIESKRPHSIDLTLELERQLDNESLPPSSPAFPRRSQSRPQSLDPHVLASIVTQLRMSLESVTKERDGLAHLYAEAQSSQVELKDTVTRLSERCTGLEDDLAAAVEKQKEDADAVTMLRGKLEDSRRALMRLQTESRRMSQASNLTIDLTRAGQPSYGALGSGKRASFTPLTGSPASRGQAHRRIASVSDSGFVMSAPHTGDNAGWPSSPRSFAQDQPPSRRVSSFFGRAPLPLDLPTTIDASEVEELRKELQAIKEQLDETRHELTEVQEAREASETCVNALRTFISEHSIGLGPAAANQMGTSTKGSMVAQDNTGASRWSFKLWKSDSAPAGSASIPVSPPALPPTVAPMGSAAPSRFGSFFSSRASVSSTASSSRAEPYPQPHSGQQEPICNGSDSSSVDDLTTEPVSPASEAPRPNVMVRVNEDLSEPLAYAIPTQEDGKVVETSISEDYMPIVR